MSISKAFIASLLLSLLTVQLVHAQGNTAGMKIDCVAACAERCRLASRHNLCKRACGTCCERCNCVPPGTAGNKEVCPCYATMTTHGGRPKCP